VPWKLRAVMGGCDELSGLHAPLQTSMRHTPWTIPAHDRRRIPIDAWGPIGTHDFGASIARISLFDDSRLSIDAMTRVIEAND
jgi:hypothetical protein